MHEIIPQKNGSALQRQLERAEPVEKKSSDDIPRNRQDDGVYKRQPRHEAEHDEKREQH